MSALRTLLAVSLAPAIAHAGDNEVSIGSVTRSLRTDSANAITDDSLAGGALGCARALPLELHPGLAVWATGSFAWADTHGIMFQRTSTELDTIAFSAGARARYHLHRLVVASAAVELGMTRMSLGLTDGAASAQGTGWGPSSHVGAALDLFALRRSSASLGLRVELGYAAAAPVRLVARPASSNDDTLQLDMTSASLGGLNLSGATFAVSLVSEL